MSEMRFQAVPIFRIFDEAKAREFYIDYLGCRVDWEHRFEPGLPLYMQVSRGDLVLHLSEHHGDCCPGSTALVRTTGIDALHASCGRRTTSTSAPASRSPRGTRR